MAAALEDVRGNGRLHDALAALAVSIAGMMRKPTVVWPSVLALMIGTEWTQAWAWGAGSHRLIAELAETQITPAARAQLNRLLALDPGATLASVSTWADETKDRSTARWHFVNLTAGCGYVSARDCGGGACVVEAINQQVAVLQSKAPDRERLQALKYVVHFVGDVHQPGGEEQSFELVRE